MSPLWIRYAIRSLRRTPSFTITAALTLAIGIGAASAMFAVVYGVLLAPLPYGNANRLVSVDQHQSPATFFTYKQFATSIDNIGLYRSGTGNMWVGKEPSDPEQVATAWFSASMLPTMQVSPILGRAFTDDEDRPSGETVALISEGMWRTRFGGSRDVLGKTIYVNSVQRKIIGVLPASFRFPAPDIEVWFPTRLDANTRYAGDFSYSAIARLKPGVTPDDARRDLASALPRIAESYATIDSGGMSTVEWLRENRPAPVVTPLRDSITAGIARTLWMLAVAAGLVLLVACASVANLVLIRADERQLELAVREALGASRLRVLAQFFAESTVLSVFAGALGLAAAWMAVQALVAYGPQDIPRLAELSVDAYTIAFTLVISMIAALFAAVVPTLHAARASSYTSLREGGRTATGGNSRHRLRATIASLQIALALVVLAGSALLLRTFQELRDVQPGFDATNVTTLWVQLPFARYGDSSVVRFFAALTDRVGKLPGVIAAGVASRVPLDPDGSAHGSFAVDMKHASLQMYSIDDGYLRAMHIPIVTGHRFERIDVQRPLEVLVSRRAAELLWGDTSGRAAIGKRLTMVAGGPTYNVIGVTEDVRDRSLSMPPEPTVYFPQVAATDPVLGRTPRHSMAIVVQTAGARGAIATSVSRIVHELDPTLPTFNVQSMSDVLRASTAQLSFTLILIGAAAVITVLLGAIGIYGVTAYVVTLRRREFGLRIALGAEPRRIEAMMMRQGLSLALSGVIGGTIVFVLVARFLRTFLYGVAPTDPVALLGAGVALLSIAVIASWVPARRTATIDPAEALRAE
jgi:predicted permease